MFIYRELSGGLELKSFTDLFRIADTENRGQHCLMEKTTGIRIPSNGAVARRRAAPLPGEKCRYLRSGLQKQKFYGGYTQYSHSRPLHAEK